MPRIYQRRPLAERFWEHVTKGDGCWEWQASRHTYGYGQLYDPRVKRAVQTHRLSWELHCGMPPDGMVVMHKCDNPPCVRPDHLKLGTWNDNVRDMMQKGRGMTGERNAAAKLNSEIVMRIRELYAEGKAPAEIRDVLGLHGVGEYAIRNAATRRSWAHVA